MAAVLQPTLQDDRPRPVGERRLSGRRRRRKALGRAAARRDLAPARADHRKAMRAGLPRALHVRRREPADRIDRDACTARECRETFPAERLGCLLLDDRPENGEGPEIGKAAGWGKREEFVGAGSFKKKKK